MKVVYDSNSNWSLVNVCLVYSRRASMAWKLIRISEKQDTSGYVVKEVRDTGDSSADKFLFDRPSGRVKTHDFEAFTPQ